MSELKTKPTDKSVDAFLAGIEHKTRRSDGLILLDLFKRVTGEKPVMWGDSIIGFGQYHYTYKSGHQGDWMLSGFSPRKANLVIYMMGCYHNNGFDGQKELFERLGKHKMGASCLYINKLADIDMKVLESLISNADNFMRAHYH